MATRRRTGKSKRRPARGRKSTKKRRPQQPGKKRSTAAHKPKRAPIGRKKPPLRSKPQPKLTTSGRDDRIPSIKNRRVVVRFRVPVPFTDDFRDKPGEWDRLGHEYGPIHLGRMFPKSHEQLGKMETESRNRDPGRRWPSLSSYFLLTLTPGRPIDMLVRELQQWPQLDLVYIDEPTMNAQLSAVQCLSHSGHVDGGAVGIGAQHAWMFKGGEGEGQRLVDVEEGWSLKHNRYSPRPNIQLFAGVSRFGEKWHGTQVLGIICGKNKVGGCEGIVPGLKRIDLVSCYPGQAPNPPAGPQVRQDIRGTERLENVYDAVGIAITRLKSLSARRGSGVVLFERQTVQGWPLEVLDGIFLLLEHAKLHGLTIIEPAGNRPVSNSHDLDSFVDATGTHILQRQFRDSGAIMVGSSRSAFAGPGVLTHDRFPTSNFGSRVDCYAWGENVVAAGFDAATEATNPPAGVINQCEVFGETSAASAIIAGVALAVQGIVARSGSPRLGAAALREILSDPNNGTPCTAGEGINVMPSLVKILTLDANGKAPVLGVTPVLRS